MHKFWFSTKRCSHYSRDLSDVRSTAVKCHENILNLFFNSSVSIQLLPELEVLLQIESAIEQVKTTIYENNIKIYSSAWDLPVENQLISVYPLNLVYWSFEDSLTKNGKSHLDFVLLIHKDKRKWFNVQHNV